ERAPPEKVLNKPKRLLDDDNSLATSAALTPGAGIKEPTRKTNKAKNRYLTFPTICDKPFTLGIMLYFPYA
ncbi:hypothetical protein EBQ91_02145, partial [bacterium]|nr:hypothetical protein [bacterium]